MRTAVVVLLVFAGSWTLAGSSAAQEDSQDGQMAGIAQLLGQGSAIRGMITASAAGSFTIRTGEGEVYKVLYSPNTRLMKDRQPIDAGAIHVGDTILAAGQIDKKAKTMGAVFLYDVDAAEARKIREGFGKTWTAGKVTAIHDRKIAIALASDPQTKIASQIVTVDENTSFRRQKQSVTLADVKVGDFISVRGALHGNAFLASILRVMEPGSGTGRLLPPPGNPVSGAASH